VFDAKCTKTVQVSNKQTNKQHAPSFSADSKLEFGSHLHPAVTPLLRCA